jgi:putative hydrolase of the HAD superfamily
MPIPPEVRAIYFDAVGTLIHPNPPAAIVYAEIGRRYGSARGVDEITHRFRTAFYSEEVRDRACGWRTSESREEARWRRIVTEVLEDASDLEACFHELFTHFSRADAWRLESDAAPVIRELSTRGYRLGIASNYDHRLRSVVTEIPDLAPIERLAISAELGWRKPAREFFGALCEQARLAANQVLLVGDDRINDYEGARAAGLPAWLIGQAEHEDLPAADRIRSLRQLLC